MTIDGYSHCGISKYLPVDAVLRVMEKADVERAVLVQHLGEFDNSYLEACVAKHPDRFTAVGLVDHLSADWSHALDKIAQSGCFSGIRIPEEALTENAAFCEGVMARSLVPLLDLPGGVGRLIERVRELARVRPDVPVVISHLGYPEVDDGRMVRGHEIVELAAEPSMTVLLSGQSQFCEYPYAPLADLRDSVLGAFGPDRVMWGSNFPYLTDEDDYVRDLSLTAPLAAGVRGGTAQRVFFGPTP
jgi:L-fuconolactonase